MTKTNALLQTDVAKLRDRQKLLGRVLVVVFGMIMACLLVALTGAFPSLGEVATLGVGVLLVAGACLAALAGMTGARIKALSAKERN